MGWESPVVTSPGALINSREHVGDWPSRGDPRDWGLSCETDNPPQAMESNENSPPVPGIDRNLTEVRLSEKNTTNAPSTERTLTWMQV